MSSPSTRRPFALAIGGGIAGALIATLALQPGSPDTAPQVVQPTPELVQPPAEEPPQIDETERAQAQLVKAQAQVVGLNQALEARELEMQQMKADRSAANTRASARWQAMEQELELLQVQLAEAEAARDQAKEQLTMALAELDAKKAELTQTLAELDEQIQETRKAQRQAKVFKQASGRNLWAAFGENAKVRVCDRGTRRGLDRCHEAVDQALDEELAVAFSSCVDDRHAMPVLMEGSRGEALPAHAVPLPDDRFTRGWYVSLCDPTLPEAGDPLETPPPVFVATR